MAVFASPVGAEEDPGVEDSEDPMEEDSTGVDISLLPAEVSIDAELSVMAAVVSTAEDDGAEVELLADELGVASLSEPHAAVVRPITAIQAMRALRESAERTCYLPEIGKTEDDPAGKILDSCSDNGR